MVLLQGIGISNNGSFMYLNPVKVIRGGSRGTYDLNFLKFLESKSFVQSYKSG